MILHFKNQDTCPSFCFVRPELGVAGVLGNVTKLPLSPLGGRALLSGIQAVSLLEEVVTPRKDLPPLLLKLNERPAEHLDYLGVSYGLTPRLLK